jgi:hypothetical protein
MCAGWNDRAVSELRVGDAERERTARLLREHCAVGRLELDELDGRLARVYAARTQDELDVLTADLPASARELSQGTTRLWWPAVAAFHVERQLRGTPLAVYEERPAGDRAAHGDGGLQAGR